MKKKNKINAILSMQLGVNKDIPFTKQFKNTVEMYNLANECNWNVIHWYLNQ
jgi:hypothetical protein